MTKHQDLADGWPRSMMLLVPCIPLSFVAVITLLPGPMGIVLSVATTMFVAAAAVAVAGRRDPERLRPAERGAHVVRRFAALGAALQVTILIATNYAVYEGIDVIVFLGPMALLLGAAGGATIGIAVLHRRSGNTARVL